MTVTSCCYLRVVQHPYPSEEQKKDLAEQTGLTLSQVNNWYARMLVLVFIKIVRKIQIMQVGLKRKNVPYHALFN